MDNYFQRARGKLLGLLHTSVGIGLLIGTLISGIELNFGFFVFSCLGILYIFFGSMALYSSWYKYNPHVLNKFYIWSKSSIVFTIVLTIFMIAQLKYNFNGDIRCEMGYWGACYGTLVAFTIVPILFSTVAIYLFPQSVAQEDEKLLIPTLELEDLIIPAAQPAETNPLRRAVIKFNNTSMNAAIQFLIEEQVITGKAIEVANFLYMEPNLHLSKIGEFLGEFKPLNVEVLKCYTECFQFTGMNFDEALRFYLSKFRLPGEAQKIDRIMEAFSMRFCSCNPDIFPSKDTAYVLAFSLIMLNTDIHNPAIKRKMSLEAFINQNRGIAGGKDLPTNFLTQLYKSIQNEGIKIEGDSVFSQAVQKGWLHKYGTNKKWQIRYFVVSNNCLFYFKSTEDHDPSCIIPLEGLSVVKNREVKGHPFCLELYDPSQTKIKSVKLERGNHIEGHHESFVLSCDSERELERWINSLNYNMVSNPVMQLINQKILQMEQSQQEAVESLIED